MQRIGIIMGAGPTSSAYFYKKLVHKYRIVSGLQPELILYNLTFPTETERSFLSKTYYDTNIFDLALEKAIVFMKSNYVKIISFPCFSLTYIAEQKCKKHNLFLLNPYNYLPNVENSKLGIITANYSSKLTKYLSQKINKELIFPLDYIDDIQKIITQIINNEKTEEHENTMKKIEALFMNNDISNYVIACSELCMIDFKSKINSINLLDILIEKTIEELVK